MKQALGKLDKGLPKNSRVRVATKGNGWISLSSLEPQQEPLHLSLLKAEVMRRWPMTNLLDILKEADLRVDFTDYFQTLPCVHALGCRHGHPHDNSPCAGRPLHNDFIVVRLVMVSGGVEFHRSFQSVFYLDPWWYKYFSLI